VLSVRGEVGIDDVADASEAETEAAGEFRLAWLWAEGWRARLRKGGDIVEKARWEWRVDDIGRPNMVPLIVARVPGVSVLKGEGLKPVRVRRKSVHWA
jgi:hypothetical protein